MNKFSFKSKPASTTYYLGIVRKLGFKLTNNILKNKGFVNVDLDSRKIHWSKFAEYKLITYFEAKQYIDKSLLDKTVNDILERQAVIQKFISVNEYDGIYDLCEVEGLFKTSFILFYNGKSNTEKIKNFFRKFGIEFEDIDVARAKLVQKIVDNKKNFIHIDLANQLKKIHSQIRDIRCGL